MSRAIQPQTQQHIPSTQTPPPFFNGITLSYSVQRGKEHFMQVNKEDISNCYIDSKSLVQ